MTPTGVRSLIVTSNFPPVVGGSCKVYSALAEAGQGLVYVLTARRSFRDGLPIEGTAEVDAAAPYQIRRLDLLRPVQSRRGHLWPIVDFLIMLRLLYTIGAICLREHITVVCIGDLIYAGWLIWPLRRLLRRRVLVYVHGEEMTEVGSGRFDRWKGLFMREADGAIAVSSFARDIAIARLRADPARVAIVFNGVDLDTFRPMPPDPAFTARWPIAGKRVLLTVARLVERKGVDTVLRALPEILHAAPDIHYVVVGAGVFRPRLDALVQQLGLADHVTFTGELPTADLPRLYSLAQVFVMPNRRLPNGDDEGFGLVFLEANACGCPVIAGRAGGTADAVRDHETGLLVDGEDTGAVAAAIIALLHDEPRRQAMARAGLVFAAASGWAGRFRLYQSIVERPRLTARPRAAREHQVFPVPPGPTIAVPDTPQLLVVIDAEEEFDWTSFLADATSVTNMRHQGRAQAILGQHGISPTYMLDYPVAMQPDGYEPIQAFLASGSCSIGAQLHPWVNPPLSRKASPSGESFPGNLPAEEEFAKLERLTDAIEQRFGVRPVAYRAGRYGAGQNTVAALRALGYRVDCSVLPCTDLTETNGPDYLAWTAAPAWLDEAAGLLEVPTTVGLVGSWATLPRRQTLLANRWGKRFHLPGILARLGLLERIKLTPEGTTLEDAKRLTQALHARGQRTFVITYHTSSLVPGFTPYVRSEAELDRFLAWIDHYCAWFINELGGRPTTLDELYRDARAAGSPPATPTLARSPAFQA